MNIVSELSVRWPTRYTQNKHTMYVTKGRQQLQTLVRATTVFLTESVFHGLTYLLMQLNLLSSETVN